MTELQGLPNQERFLLSEKITGVQAILPVSYRIKGPFNLGRFQEALLQLVSNREMLRAKAFLDDDEKCTIVMQSLPSDADDILTYIDLGNVHKAKVQEELKSQIAAVISKNKGVFEVLLLRLGPEEHSVTIIPHHSVIDGVSIGILLTELSKLYNTPEAILEPDTGGFKKAAIDLQETAVEARLQAEAYWQKQLLSIATQPGIVAAIPPMTSPIDATDYVVQQIPQSLHEEARAIAHALNVRTFSLYLALGQIALQRVTGEEDIATAIQSAGRSNLGIHQKYMGMFSKALIIRTPNDGNSFLGQQIQSVDELVSQAIENDTLSYHQVIQQTGTNPRFAFNWFPPHAGLQLDNCECFEEILHPWPTTFDLNFHFVKTSIGLELRTFFNQSRCDTEIANFVTEQIITLLKSLVANTPKKINDLPSVSAGPIGIAGASRRSLGRIDTVFEEQVRRSPDRTAISYLNNGISYAQLQKYSNALANEIANQKIIAPRVAILGHRGPGLVIAALASAQSGGSFALIDPCYPDARIQSMTSVLEPDLIVECTDLLNEAPDFTSDFATIRHDNIPGIHRILQRGQQRETTDRSDAAYWLFTSGSTGKPKCLSSDHAPLLNALEWQKSTFSIEENVRVSFLSGVSHDPALRDIFLPILHGGCLCIPDPARIFEPNYLRNWIRQERVNISHLTPAMIRLLEVGAQRNDTTDDLRTVFVGGDKSTHDIIDILRKLTPKAQLYNVYGASETPQIVIFNALDYDSFHGKYIRIGQPRQDIAVHICDKHGRTCGVFEPGEIAIETAYLSNGYLESDKNKNSAFEFSSAGAGRGLYRTGDIGFYSGDNKIVLIGRNDDQIKVRGFRVELGEITSSLQRVTGTSAAIVVDQTTEGGETRLIAFVEQDLGFKCDEQQIRSALGKLLPTYMIPDFVMLLPQIPLLPSGKIDKAALRDMPLPDPSGKTGYVAPINQEEKSLVEIWERVLGVTPISVTESFFDLGGDSLTSVRLMLEMERSGLSEQTARAIMQGATIRELAQANEIDGVVYEPKYGTIPNGPLLSRMSIHSLRGLLVFLIVCGHWFPGLIARLPSLEGLGQLLKPVFNLSTPGFAIAFGMSLGYFNFETYLRRQDIYRRQIQLGIGILIAALCLIAILRLSETLLQGNSITSHIFFMSFYNVLGFYFLAVASMPLWFTWIKRTNGKPAGFLALLLVYVLLDYGFRKAFLQFEPQGLVQLTRLYTTAKFSYFNMSIGAILGLATGYMIRNHPDLPQRKAFPILGIILVVSGLSWGNLNGEIDELLGASSRIDLWKWCLYFGVVIFLCAVLWPIVAKHGNNKNTIGFLLRLLGSVGILALPFFIFHGLVLDIKAFLDALSVPDFLGILSVMSLFFLIGGLAVRKVWKLYFH